jgi:hypothetical protein
MYFIPFRDAATLPEASNSPSHKHKLFRLITGIGAQRFVGRVL